ncbi:MAG TPA: hypothetical protein VIY52_29895 [Streptosporangiaceae bacterium]
MFALDDGAVVVGHSVGAAILLNALAGRSPEKGLGAVVLIAAPFVGEGGWLSGEFELTSDLGAELPPGAQVDVFHGLRDETAPPSHAGLYAAAIPQAQGHQLPGRDHQLNNDLSEVAEAIRISRPRPVAPTSPVPRLLLHDIPGAGPGARPSQSAHQRLGEEPATVTASVIPPP